ncbi:hypothetical protein JHK87_036472 [Glycine soja]|nr:hypothetical protein JHK87_036472 [Glycine soja]
MNFNLDGEFNKISSFKLDMSDLDFTCPAKKNSQSKDKKGEVSGSQEGKQDGFNFSFDFNDYWHRLGSFNFDSSFMKVVTTSNSSPRKKGVTTEGSDKEGGEMLKTNDDEGARASNDSTTVKSHASVRLETSKVETVVGSPGNLVSKQDGSVSKISSSGNLDMPMENQTLDINKHKSTEEIDQERDLPEKSNLTGSKSEQVINMASSQSVGESDSEQHTISDQHTNAFSSGTRVSDIQEVNDKATNVKSDSVDLQLEHSSPHHITKSDSSVGEAITLGSSTQEGVTSDPQPEKSKPVVEKMMLMKDKKLQDLQSNMFSTPEGKRSLKQPSSTIGTKGSSLGNEKNIDILLGSITQARCVMLVITVIVIGLSMVECSFISLNRENFRSNDTKHGRKLVGDSLTDSSKLMRNAGVLLGSKDDLKSCSNTREGIVSDVSPCSGKLAGNKQSFFDEVNKSKTTFLEIGISTEDVSMLRSFGANRVLTTALHQKETNSLVSSGQSMDKWGITTSKNDHSIDSSDNQKSSTPFLKRKTIEKFFEHLKDSIPQASDADFTLLRPLKCISQSSPSKSRSSKESSEEVVGEVESMPNNLLYNHSTSGLKSSPVIKVTEVEIHDPLLMEDNNNVEKAEAYIKELEDVQKFASQLMPKGIQTRSAETRPLRNHDPFSSHSPPSSLFFSSIKHYIYPGSEGSSLAKKSVKVSYSIGFRNSNATGSHYYRPNRVSPGGPDAHHHFKTVNNTLN